MVGRCRNCWEPGAIWRIPVMDGEFVCEATVALTREAVGGGNLLILGAGAKQTLAAAEAAVEAIEAVPDAIMPFPGGIARSGSKIGAKYKNMRASTNDAYCPTLRGVVKTALDPEIASVLEIVIDGLTSEAVANAMRAGLRAIVELGATAALRVSAGNYGGKLGPHHYHLEDSVAHRRRSGQRKGRNNVSPLVFRSRVAPEQRLDLSPLTPQRLAGKSEREIGNLELQTTRRAVRVGDLFDVSNGSAEQIVVEGGSEKFDRVGEGMNAGSITINGDVGNRAGRAMAGGRLMINGNSGHWTASGMTAGLIEISGDVGDRLGGPLAGEVEGMNGGMVVVRGRAGARAADRLRRGVLIIEGDAGEDAGSRMLAGTLIVCGSAGARTGYLMRRGTIVLGAPAATWVRPSSIAAFMN